MAKKKNNGDLSLTITSSFFEELTKLDDDNYKEYMKSYSIFFIISSIKNKLTMINSFTNRPQIKKGVYMFHFYWNGEIHSNRMVPRVDEDVNDYNNMISDVKSIIKQELKNGRLYARKIE